MSSASTAEFTKKRPPSFRPNRILRALSIRSNRADTTVSKKERKSRQQMRAQKSSSLPEDFVNNYNGPLSGSFHGALSGSYHGPLSMGIPIAPEQQQLNSNADKKSQALTRFRAAAEAVIHPPSKGTATTAASNSLLARSLRTLRRLPRKAAPSEPRWVDNKSPLGIYELLLELGKGAYGSVWKAQRRRDGMLFAIKIVPARADALMHQKEIELLEISESTYVVHYHDSYQSKEFLWIVMDLCEGGSVYDLMHVCQMTLNEDQLRMIIASLLMGIAHLHHNGVVHRDIKASNCLLTGSGQVKLADFGISTKLRSPSDTLNAIVGTPYFIAPEVILEVGYGTPADLWSLGITLIEMAEGTCPNHHLHPMRALFEIPRQPPPTFKVPQLWSENMQDFLSSCLTKDPEVRPNAQQLLIHPWLREVVDSLQTSVPQGTSVTLRKMVEASLSKLQSFRYEHRILQERQRELEVRRMHKVVHAQILNLGRRPQSTDSSKNQNKARMHGSSAGRNRKVSEAYEWVVGFKNIWNASEEGPLSPLSSFENNFDDLDATFVRTNFSDSTMGSALDDGVEETDEDDDDDRGQHEQG